MPPHLSNSPGEDTGGAENPPPRDLSSCPIVDEAWIAGPGLMAERAEGSRIFAYDDPDPYDDFIAAYSSANFGYGSPEMLRDLQDAARRGAENIVAFNCPERIALSEKLLRHLVGGGTGHQVRYPVTGARAVDDAWKLAMLYTRRPKVISLTGAFHGCTKSAIELTDPKFTGERYRGLVPDPITIPFPDIHDAGSYEQSLDALRALLHGREDIAAVITEPVQGAAGFRLADPRFFQELRSISREHGILLIMDEIQMGLGRTGDFYAHERFGIDPDIVLLGKSLAGGVWPLSAFIARREYFECAGSGRCGFESTFDNNVFAIRCAHSVMKRFEENHILDHVRQMAPSFEKHMRAIQAKHSSVISRLNAIGLAAGLETPSAGVANAIKERVLRQHLIIQPAGMDGNYIKLSPPLTITERELEEGVTKLDHALQGL